MVFNGNYPAPRFRAWLKWLTWPGTQQGGSPALVYNSRAVSVKPVIQAEVQTDNSRALPAHPSFGSFAIVEIIGIGHQGGV